jgi:ABC-type nickel/cobalt efflux system permease component RcnA
MERWEGVIIFIIIMLVAWWAMWRNAMTYKPDFEIHHAEGEGHLSPHNTVDEAAVLAATSVTAETPATPDD